MFEGDHHFKSPQPPPSTQYLFLTVNKDRNGNLVNIMCDDTLDSAVMITPWGLIKMTPYQYRNSQCGDKMILSSYLQNCISYTDKMTSLYWISPTTILAVRQEWMKKWARMTIDS